LSVRPKRGDALDPGRPRRRRCEFTAKLERERLVTTSEPDSLLLTRVPTSSISAPLALKKVGAVRRPLVPAEGFLFV